MTDSDMLRILENTRTELQQYQQKMSLLISSIGTATNAEIIARMQFEEHRNVYGYLELLATLLEVNVYSTIELRNAINKLPNRDEFEASKSEVRKVEQKAIESVKTIEKLYTQLKEHEPPKDMAGYA